MVGDALLCSASHPSGPLLLLTVFPCPGAGWEPAGRNSTRIRLRQWWLVTRAKFKGASLAVGGCTFRSAVLQNHNIPSSRRWSYHIAISIRAAAYLFLKIRLASSWKSSSQGLHLCWASLRSQQCTLQLKALWNSSHRGWAAAVQGTFQYRWLLVEVNWLCFVADNKSLTVGVLITILCLTFAGSVMYLKRKTLMRLLFTSKKTTIEKLRYDWFL